ncbi:GNAT family N-acetyltransferase [Micromonospora sp. NPDC007271]|uniref:GNAT family N-acetyltransferase n=1 Tax=Micromonospora sp. NPDC007271 TaxID=3154587 RepID=UPI00340CD265
MTVRTGRRIADLADDWARTITHDSVLTLPEWLATDDEGRDGETRYLLSGENGQGAGLVANPIAAGTFPTNDPVALLLSSELEPGGEAGLVARIGDLRATLADDLASCYPVAVSTLPGGYLPGLVGDLRPENVRLLLDGLQKAASDWGCEAVSVLHVPDGSPLTGELRRRGFVGAAFLAQAQLDLTAKDFDEYLAGLPKRRRNKIRRERREFAEAGFTVRLDDIGRRSREMAELHAAQLQSYGYHQVTAERLQGLMDRIERHLAPWCRILVAERDGELEAFALAYEYAGELHLKMTGFSASAQEHFGYFAMSYYALIEYALQAGVHTIVYGPLTYHAKVVRGCALSPRSSYLLVPEPLRERVAQLAELIDRHNRAVFTAMGTGDR